MGEINQKDVTDSSKDAGNNNCDGDVFKVYHRGKNDDLKSIYESEDTVVIVVAVSSAYQKYTMNAINSNIQEVYSSSKTTDSHNCEAKTHLDDATYSFKNGN